MFSSSNRSCKALKTTLVYLVVSAFCILINYIYSFFGHGVRSPWMTYLFLFPLIGGALVYLLAWLVAPALESIRHFRIFYNLYNAGIATLAAGSMLLGVFDIAGTSSPYTVYYFLVGGGLAITASIGFLWSMNRSTPYGG